ncbi:YtoQ family protein [Lacimicrobium alkaliphilum]|uniref:Uncharacterized protein n=1 Tax=Lacimicrobium alkaliphilum TaxID=1526571 RepID=A0ABQ1RMI9_9ALTE|nr:YtoQ family protein [Lacimicrobium alkaliphilum]GGD71990.1 hypothetical protein GCM10011357_28760 [Lacimicrobium alkaliphilum]
MYKRVYLAGDNHSCWQQELQSQARKARLAISFRCSYKQVESDSIAMEAGSAMAGARRVEALNDALLSRAELIIVRFSEDSDHRSNLVAVAQAIVRGKSVMVLYDNEMADKFSSIPRVATAVAGDLAQLLSLLDIWSTTNKATDNN